MKKNVTYNQYYEKFDDFKKHIRNFFKNIKEYEDELVTLMTEKFQLFPT